MKKRNNSWPELKRARETMHILHKGYQDSASLKRRMETNDRYGANRIISTLKELSENGSRALHIAAYVFSRLEIMRKDSEDINIMLAEIDCRNNLAAYMSEIGILLSAIDAKSIERLETAIIYCHELFNIDNMDCSLDEHLDLFRD